MKSASSQVASSGDMLSHCTNHCVTKCGCQGTALVCKTSTGAILILPASSTSGKPGAGIALGPR
uniref:Uncharacterized protein n=1 Tax=Triticum urartu TaxID=4572 RepID=A0A8R7QY67_TRIUA